MQCLLLHFFRQARACRGLQRVGKYFIDAGFKCVFKRAFDCEDCRICIKFKFSLSTQIVPVDVVKRGAPLLRAAHSNTALATPACQDALQSAKKLFKKGQHREQQFLLKYGFNSSKGCSR